MPTYEYRCNHCQRTLTLFYKTYKDFDNATPTCTHCGSPDLTRLISRVSFKRPARDFTQSSPEEMLSVLESGDSREVGRMMQQIGGDDPSLGGDYHEAAERLADGETMDSVEQDLSAPADDASGADAAWD